jgi:general secretion pathway protein D
LRFRLFIALLLVLLITPARSHAQRQGTLVTMDFKDVEIEDLVKTIAKLTGRNFMVDERVRGKVTIISPTPITVAEAYRVFLAVLEFKNLTVVPSGKLLKIIPNQNAMRYPTELTDGRSPLQPSDAFVTRIVKLNYVDANETLNLLNNFKSTYGMIFAYAPSNMLIIGDSAAQINRMLEMIGQIDVAGSELGMEFIKLQNGSAADIAKTLNDIYAAQQQQQQQGGGGSGASRRAGRRGAGTQVKIVNVDRLNSIIVIASSADIADVRELVSKLDVKAEQGGGTIHVYYLSYADAEQLASTLGGFTQGAGQRKQGQAAVPGQPPASVGTVEFEGGIKITPDKATNALIIVSSPGDYTTLKNLIRKLDVPRRQVYVEAIIMEVSVDKVRELGLSWHALNDMGGDGVAFGGQALGGVNTLTLGSSSVPQVSGMFMGALAKPVDLGGGVSVFGIGALLRALQSDESVNILSAPNILTSDNEDAEIVVGQNVPFITGQTATTGGNVLTSIERQDVGITLKLNPQINANGYVRLKIQQESSSVQQSAPAGLNVNQQGLTTRKRSAKTTILVRDRQTAVIGGLMSDEIDESNTKIPVLGDVPILGWLFKSAKKTNRKTNLLLFLTPYIINTREDLDHYTDKREEFFHQFREDNYIEPLSEEYTFRRTYGQRVGGSEVVDEALMGEDYTAPPPGPVTSAAAPGRGETAPGNRERAPEAPAAAAAPVPKPVSPAPGEEQDLQLKESPAPATLPAAPAPVTAP